MLDTEIKKTDAGLRVAIERRTERQTEQDLSLKIYEKVYAALQTKEPRTHEVAYALVQSLEDDKPRTRHDTDVVIHAWSIDFSEFGA